MGSNKPTWEHEREEELASPKYVGAVTLGWGEVFLLNLCFDDWKICICEVGVEERRCRKRRDLEGLLLSSCWGVFANICLNIHFCMDIRLQGLINPNGLEYLTKNHNSHNKSVWMLMWKGCALFLFSVVRYLLSMEAKYKQTAKRLPSMTEI